MLRAGVWLVSRAGRTAAAATGLMTLLALQPESARLVEAASAGTVPEARVTHTLVLSDQARRFLSLQYKSFATEFMGCMIGEVRGQTVVVSRIAPADVEPAQSAATHVVPKESCESAGWTGTVGMIHSHPTGERCWYFFPGTQVASSDGVSFTRAATGSARAPRARTGKTEPRSPCGSYALNRNSRMSPSFTT